MVLEGDEPCSLSGRLSFPAFIFAAETDQKAMSPSVAKA
jgi:hypothetical protein